MIKKGKWRLRSWKDIALSAGLDKTHAEAFYNYLCGYAHAGNLSVLQLRQAQNAASQKALCAATIGVLMITIANMIKSYSLLSPKSTSVLQDYKDAATLVDMWISVGSKSMEGIEVDWESENLGI